MQDIELQAMKYYEENLLYLSKEHPKVFKKVQAFDIAQEEGKITARYDLEYKDSYFDVKEIQSNQYLYSTNSILYSKEVADSINFKKDSALFSGLKEYLTSDEQIKRVKEVTELTGSNIKDILPIMNYSMKIAPNTTSMKKIDKFIFIGVALGLHILAVDKKIESDEYLIIEDDLELFRLSLFTTPYYELATHSNLHFAISQNETDFTFTMLHFLEGSFFNNRYLKYFHLPTHATTKIKLIQNNLASQNHITFPYDIQMNKILRPLKRIKKGYKTINLSTKFPDSIISQKPVIILAAGPSFKKNLTFLKEHSEKFIIIAVTAVLKTLYENGIKPDIVTHIDGIVSEGNSCMIHFDGFNASKFLKDTVLIFGTHAPDSLLDMFEKQNIFFFEGATYYFNDFGTLSTPCIGSTSVVLAIWLNAKNIYLLGLDLALDQETGATHSGDHLYNETHDLENIEEIDYTISLRENIIPIKGNFKKIVYSTPIFLISVRSLFSNISYLKDETQHIYNLNDGAFIEGTTPMHIEDIETEIFNKLEKNSLFNTLYDIVNKRARDHFNKEELDSLKKRLENAEKIVTDLKEYEKKTFTNDTKYLYDLLGIVSSILKVNGREGENLAAIYSSFFQYTLPYIVDIRNTKEMTKMMIHLKKIDMMFVEGCYSIINLYIKEIEKFFE